MRTYKEICEDLRNAQPGKECRELHKELRLYGDGMRFRDRYPWFPVIFMVMASTGAIVAMLTILL